MLLRFALMIGAVSQILPASDFSTNLFANQNTGTLRDLNRQALDQQIRSSLLGQKPATKNPSLPIQPKSLLNGRAEARGESSCSIPLAQMKIDNTKQYAIKALKAPKSDFDPISVAPPLPVCKR